jgi:PAS domain S-box-containing protein
MTHGRGAAQAPSPPPGDAGQHRVDPPRPTTSTSRADATLNDGRLHPRQWLRVPWRTRPFWATQALVMLIAGAHAVLEHFHILDHASLYFVPVSLYFIPVVYAATRFGTAGSVPTALWCFVLTIPNALFWHAGEERAGEIFQMIVIVLVAVFVGRRVDEQLRARRLAEDASHEWRLSEERYRSLFENAGEAVLVVEGGALIVECNPAAARLLGTSVGELRGALVAASLPASLGRALVRACASPGRPGGDVLVSGPGNEPVWVEPVCTQISREPDRSQVVLRDVTTQKSRQQRLETFASAVLQAQEEERSRVAHELHDETIQSLIQLCRMIDECGCGVPAGNGRAGVLRQHTEATITNIRRFIAGLRPPALDDLGLTAVIERCAHDLGDRASLDVDIEISGTPRRLSTEAELVLFRIAQEALHNVERHAAASRVSVELDYQPELVSLTVVDDGRGFDVEAAERALDRHRLGIMGMRERARSVGGTLSVESAPGTGAAVAVELPCRPLSRRGHS